MLKRWFHRTVLSRRWLTFLGGMGSKEAPGLFDYAINYLFFVPNLLVAEFFIRNKHKRIAWARPLKWPAMAPLAVGSQIFVYAIAVVSATHSGKYGRHLVELVTG